MQKHSQILERLEQTSKEQNKQIEQLHQQGLTNLEKSLTSLYSDRLNKIGNATVNTIQKTVTNELQAKNKLILITSIALTMIVSILATWYITKAMIWEVPKNLQITDKDNRYILIEGSQLIADSKTKNRYYLPLKD